MDKGNKRRILYSNTKAENIKTMFVLLTGCKQHGNGFVEGYPQKPKLIGDDMSHSLYQKRLQQAEKPKADRKAYNEACMELHTLTKAFSALPREEQLEIIVQYAQKEMTLKMKIKSLAQNLDKCFVNPKYL